MRTLNQRADLSPRQCQVVKLVAEAKLNKEIAYELGLTESTVRLYVSAIFRKLNFHNRVELATWYARSLTNASS